jgi:hypothetical protein
MSLQDAHPLPRRNPTKSRVQKISFQTKQSLVAILQKTHVIDEFIDRQTSQDNSIADHNLRICITTINKGNLQYFQQFYNLRNLIINIVEDNHAVFTAEISRPTEAFITPKFGILTTRLMNWEPATITTMGHSPFKRSFWTYTYSNSTSTTPRLLNPITINRTSNSRICPTVPKGVLQPLGVSRWNLNIPVVEFSLWSGSSF